jgi:hypothetical protein
MVTTNEFMIILKANFITLVAIFFIISAIHVDETVSRTIIFIYFILNCFNSFWSYLIKKYFFKLNMFRKPIFAICDEQGEINIKNWFDKGNPFGYDIELVLNVNDYSVMEIHQKINKIVKENRFDSAVIDFDMEFSVYVSLTLIKVKNDILFNRYLMHYLNSPSTLFLATNSTTGIGVKNLNVNVPIKYSKITITLKLSFTVLFKCSASPFIIEFTQYDIPEKINHNIISFKYILFTQYKTLHRCKCGKHKIISYLVLLHLILILK